MQTCFTVTNSGSRREGELSLKYIPEIQANQNDPKLLEDLYQAALRKGESDEFAAALQACYQQSPDTMLYAAWHYRLQQVAPESLEEDRKVNWRLAVPLSVVLGLIFWILSGRPGVLDLELLAGPIIACFVIAFLILASNTNQKAAALTIAGLAGVTAYAVIFVTFWERSWDYETLMALHLPLLAWIATGFSLLWSRSDHHNRFAFLRQSIEVFFTAGLYLIAGVIFVLITFGLFEAIGIWLSDEVMRLLLAGGGGLIPILAVATAYDPSKAPSQQSFQQGLGKLITTLMRLLLPLTLLVLVIYLLVIPFNFMAPFFDRDVLIVYNVMLFAIMGLLVGATPVNEHNLAVKHHRLLRLGILVVAALTVLVSLYALSATVYRTVSGGITINRLTIIGWNSINIGILGMLIYKQLVGGPAQWVQSLQETFSRGVIGYVVWTLFLALAIPLLFR
jgi:hypothetical protein